MDNLTLTQETLDRYSGEKKRFPFSVSPVFWRDIEHVAKLNNRSINNWLETVALEALLKEQQRLGITPETYDEAK